MSLPRTCDEPGEFGQDPDMLTMAECARSIVYRLVGTDQVVEECECISILHRFVAVSHDAQNLARIRSHRSPTMGNIGWVAQFQDFLQRFLDDGVVQSGSFDRFSGCCQIGQFSAQFVPWRWSNTGKRRRSPWSVASASSEGSLQ